jgi:hypothetical protein
MMAQEEAVVEAEMPTLMELVVLLELHRLSSARLLSGK